MNVRPLNADSFRGAVNGAALSLVEFSAVWCPPCKALQPILEDLANDAPDVPIYQIDTDDHPELAAEFGVMSMPTVIAFRAGEPVEKLVGLRPKSAYEAVIRKAGNRTTS